MVTLEEMQAVLRIPEGNTAEMEYLQDCIGAATEYISGRTGIPRGGGPTATIYLDGRGSDTLWLPYPVKADPAPVIEERTGSDWTVVSAADYEIDGIRLHSLTGGWAEGRRNYRAIVASQWFLDTGGPMDLQQVATWLTVHCFTERSPVVTGTITAKMPIHLEAFLSRYGRGVKL